MVSCNQVTYDKEQSKSTRTSRMVWCSFSVRVVFVVNVFVSKQSHNNLVPMDSLSLQNSGYHGRVDEQTAIGRYYEQSRESCQYLTVSGRSGSGKTSLVEQNRVLDSQGLCFFVVGKFEARLVEPFSAMVEALDTLCLKWKNSEAGRAQIEEFSKRYPREYYMMIRFLPSLQDNAKTNPCVRKDNVMPSEGLRTNIHGFERLRSAILKLLQSIASPEKPVMILFDDIQWADKSSLDLILFLVEEDVAGLFLVGTYRSEDMSSGSGSNVLSSHLEDLQRSKRTIGRTGHIHLDGFTLSELNDVFSKLARRDKNATLPLVQVIHEKTGGNPFFIEQFLQLLQEECFLKFSFQTCQWEWGDVTEIRDAMSILSSEVAEVVADSMKKLDKATQMVLKVASCIGSQVPTPILEDYFDKSEDELLAQDSKEHQLQDLLSDLVSSRIFKRTNGTAYHQWSHSMLQHAAMTLMSDSEKNQIHLRLGKLVAKRTQEAWQLRREVLIYIAADQLNRLPTEALSMEGEDMLVGLARLNHEAALLSLSKSAYYPAAKLLRKGIYLLQIVAEHPEKSSKMRFSGGKIWTLHPRLLLDLLTVLAETCYTIGETEEAREAIEEITSNVSAMEDCYRAKSCLLEILTSGKDRDFNKGAQMCLEYLKECDVIIPTKPSKAIIKKEEFLLKKKLPTGNIESLLYFEPAAETKAVCASVFLGKLAHWAFLEGNLPLCTFASLRSFHHACDHGITTFTALSMSMYANVEVRKGDDEKAFLHGDLSLELLKKVSSEPGELYAKLLAINHSSIIALRKPLQDSLDPYARGFRLGMQTGDVEMALIGAMCYGYTYIVVGLPLSHLESDIQSYGEAARHFYLAPSIQVQFPIIEQAVLNLMGKSEHTTVLKGSAMDQDELLSEVEGNGQSMTVRDICIFRLMLAYVFRDMDVASEMLEKLLEFKSFNPAIARMHIREAYSGLAAFALLRTCPRGARKERKKYKGIAKQSFEYFKKAVQKGSTSAYPIYAFLIAEKDPSKEKYDEAIRVCARSGLKNFEAMANESCGLYFLREDRDKDWAKYYLSKAVDLFEEWNATAKARLLKEQYKFIDCILDSPRNGSNQLGKRRVSTSFLAKMKSLRFDKSDLRISQTVDD